MYISWILAYVDYQEQRIMETHPQSIFDKSSKQWKFQSFLSSLACLTESTYLGMKFSRIKIRILWIQTKLD